MTFFFSDKFDFPSSIELYLVNWKNMWPLPNASLFELLKKFKTDVIYSLFYSCKYILMKIRWKPKLLNLNLRPREITNPLNIWKKYWICFQHFQLIVFCELIDWNLPLHFTNISTDDDFVLPEPDDAWRDSREQLCWTTSLCDFLEINFEIVSFNEIETTNLPSFEFRVRVLTKWFSAYSFLEKCAEKWAPQLPKILSPGFKAN